MTFASRRSRTETLWSLPLLPRNSKRSSLPLTSTWRFRSVVRPYERFSRAYSLPPTRISVASSSRTTVASTLSRGRPAAPGPRRRAP